MILVVWKYAQMQTTRIMSLKNYFLKSGVVQNVFFCICAYFRTTRIKSLKKIIFSPFLTTCFDEFPHHQIQVLKKLFLGVWSGEKRILMHFQTTRIKSLKNYFFTSGLFKNGFLSISWPTESSF